MEDSLQTVSPDLPTAFLNGAEWVRADFHLHTKADREFQYDGEQNQFVHNYVEALMQAGIGLGVITNHNKFDCGEFKALRKEARKKNIGLLPGVELSISDGASGIHVLVIFSDGWLDNGQDLINPFLTVAFAGKTPAQYEQENGRSSLSLTQTINELEKNDPDFFLVFAHVEQGRGLWKEVRGGRIQDLGKNEAFQRRTLGFQQVRTHDGAESGKPCRTKVKGWLQDWYPAELEGSDPKSMDGIGKGKPCYMKLGAYSFDAVKFALGDPEFRVAAKVPKRTASHICSLHFQGGILNDQTLHFSPELNTLIGIRGSGKSSILEAIRYVLDIPRGDKALDSPYKDRLTKHTLGSGGKITLVAKDRFGQKFTVSRILGDLPNVFLDDKLQPGVSIRETVLKRPIYFGQKDLSSTGDGFEKDLVEKLVGEKLRPIRVKIETQLQRVRDAVSRLQKLSTTADQKREYEAQLQDATFHLGRFEKYGVAEKLKKRVGFQQDDNVLTRIHRKVENFIEGLNGFIAEHEDELRNAKSYTSEQNPEFFVEYYSEYDELLTQLEKLKQIERDTKNVANRLTAKEAEFSINLQGLQEEFAIIERKLAEDLKQTGSVAIRPDDFLKQQQRKIQAEQMLEVLSKQETKKDIVYNTLLEELVKINELWLQEFNAITKELDRVNENHTALSIEAEFKGDKEAAIYFMQQCFRGSKIREATLRSVMVDNADFGNLYRNMKKAKSNAGSSPELFENTFNQNLADFLSWQVPNRFVIRYRGKELKHHSLGQRASALILYVLSQRQNDVVIIDQPEDDLDNQTIYEDVIKLIREMKPSTQFIFATHNANFPVLGDSELVHACRYEDEKINALSGGIDARQIQEEIINIMEGGEEAFNKRKEVYNLWKPQNSSK